MNIDNIFEFEENDNGYTLTYYILGDDESYTRVDIPAEYKGKPVTEIKDNVFMFLGHITEVNIPEGIEKIGEGAFAFCRMKTLILPKSLREIGSNAFAECDCLEKVEFLGDNVVFELGVFDRCSELRAEHILQSLACSLDITKPFVKEEDYEPGIEFDWGQALREDVFELALKYDSFAFFDKKDILRKIAEYDLCELLPFVENAEWSISEELVSGLLDISGENECVETTAWLLDYKNRKF